MYVRTRVVIVGFINLLIKNIFTYNNYMKEPILGFRSWQLSDNYLYPAAVRVWKEFDDEALEPTDLEESGLEWNKGINYSYCIQDSEPWEGSPHTHHDCGFNAFFELEQAINNSFNGQIVTGACAGAGRVELHETGFRAEQAQVLALLASDEKEFDVLKTVAKNYNVPLFKIREDFLDFAHSLSLWNQEEARF